MRSAIIGFAVGVSGLQMQSALPEMPLIVALFLCAIAAACLTGLPRFRVVNIPTKILGGALFGFAWAALLAHSALSEQLPKAWEGRDMIVTGTVESLPYRFEQGVRFMFAVEKNTADDDQSSRLPSRLSLSWYVPAHAENTAALPVILPGQRWRLAVRLQRPHGTANPGGFDYEAWLLEQHIRATGYVRDDQQHASTNQLLEDFVPSVRHAIERGRMHLRDRIVTALAGREYAGVIVALVVGDQRAIGQSEWKVFSRTGVSHLMSISGLHITMVAGLFAALLFGLWRRSFFTKLQLPLFLPAQKAAALAGALAALTYVALAGFGVPAQRTLYMLSVVALALWSGRIAAISHVLCAALGLVLLVDPWAVLWPGFWLSFGAVALILYATVGRAQRLNSVMSSSRRSRWLTAMKSAAHTQYVVTLGLVPLTMLLFAQMSLASPLANAIAIPMVSFIITPLALIGSVLPAPLSDGVLLSAHWMVAQLATFLEWLSASPVAIWSVPEPAPWMFIAAMIGVLWLLAPRGWPLRWMGLFGLLPLLLNVPSHPVAGEMQVTAFDVGQGMALLVETEHHRLLYDTGPAYSAESDGGNRVIIPYLKARGIHALDGIVVSHQDNDHSGGALSILDEINVGWVASSLPAAHPIVAAVRDHRRCIAGQHWEWDGVRFEMLHPSLADYERVKAKPNARSCTLKITSVAHSMLLAGDIEAAQETELVETRGDQLAASVLLAPHHGSGTSSTPAFLQAVHPELALFQVGYRNRYHHPKPQVFERYGEMGIKRLRSDEAGAVMLHFGHNLDETEYRVEHARYWYGQ